MSGVGRNGLKTLSRLCRKGAKNVGSQEKNKKGVGSLDFGNREKRGKNVGSWEKGTEKCRELGTPLRDSVLRIV